MRSRFLILPCLVVSVVAAGAGCARSPAAAGPDQIDQGQLDPVAFLKWSMDRYKALPTYSAESRVAMTANGEPMAPLQTRAFRYAAPNRFRVVASRANGFVQTTVSDGQKLVEFTNKVDVPASSSPSPDRLDDAATEQITNPLFCGSLLYQFFGGAENLPSLANQEKSPIAFGDEETGDGEPARVVKFYGAGPYGHVQALIGEKTGYVYRIVYDEEPLLAMMRGGPHSVAADAIRAHIATMKPGPARDRAKRELAAHEKATIPSTIVCTETFSDIKTSSAVAVAPFDTTLPKGVVAVELPTAPSDKPPVPLGHPAPDFQVVGMDGKPARLSAMRGHVVMLDFWATWCPPCRHALPETARLALAGAAKGLRVLAITPENHDTVGAFLKHQSYQLPAFLDSTGEAAKAFRPDSIPTVAIIDPQGNLSAYLIGEQPPDVLTGALRKAGAQL